MLRALYLHVSLTCFVLTAFGSDLVVLIAFDCDLAVFWLFSLHLVVCACV